MILRCTQATAWSGSTRAACASSIPPSIPGSHLS